MLEGAGLAGSWGESLHTERPAPEPSKKPALSRAEGLPAGSGAVESERKRGDGAGQEAGRSKALRSSGEPGFVSWVRGDFAGSCKLTRSLRLPCGLEWGR